MFSYYPNFCFDISNIKIFWNSNTVITGYLLKFIFADTRSYLFALDLKQSEKKTIELAIQYYKDSKYYNDKKDYFTSFGCINYAHGLLDAIIKF